MSSWCGRRRRRRVNSSAEATMRAIGLACRPEGDARRPVAPPQRSATCSSWREGEATVSKRMDDRDPRQRVARAGRTNPQADPWWSMSTTDHRDGWHRGRLRRRRRDRDHDRSCGRIDRGELTEDSLRLLDETLTAGPPTPPIAAARRITDRLPEHPPVPKWSPTPRCPQPKRSTHTRSKPADLAFQPAPAGLVLVGTTGFEPAPP